MAEIKVLALVGGLRAASLNRNIAEVAVEVAPDGVAITVFDGLADLPFYNEEIDDAMTEAPAWPRWRRCAPQRPRRTPPWWSPRNTTAATRPSSRTRSTGSPGRSATAP